MNRLSDRRKSRPGRDTESDAMEISRFGVTATSWSSDLLWGAVRRRAQKKHFSFKWMSKVGKAAEETDSLDGVANSLVLSD
jgi:hypothetical protein